MTEFYHKNIFGEAVDVDLQAEVDEKLLDKKGKEFDIFKFINAFGRGNKKESWVLYEKAIMAGVPAERIFFTLMWKVRSLGLIELSERLVVGYHEARRGKGEIETLIEKTILSL